MRKSKISSEGRRKNGFRGWSDWEGYGLGYTSAHDRLADPIPGWN